LRTVLPFTGIRDSAVRPARGVHAHSETGIELDLFSGLFDFGAPRHWLTGWNASRFDSVNLKTHDGVRKEWALRGGGG
jgi:hypothetical protein